MMNHQKEFNTKYHKPMSLGEMSHRVSKRTHCNNFMAILSSLAMVSIIYFNNFNFCRFQIIMSNRFLVFYSLFSNIISRENRFYLFSIKFI